MAWLFRLAALGAAGAAATGAALAFAYEPRAQSIYSKLVAESGIRIDSGVAYGPHPRQVLDVYHAADGDVTAPLALFIYGGSWRYGHRSVYGFVGTALATRGITTIIADYRLFPEVRFPAFVDDTAQAYAWVARHLSGQGTRRRPIVLVGHSAGAHIAGLLAYDERYLTRAATDLPKPAAFVGLSGPYAFDPTTWSSTAEIFSTAASADDARPVAFVRDGAPPALLMHGLSDDLVKVWNTRELAAALQRHGTEARALELPDIGHIGMLLAISRPFRWRAPVLDETVAFIKRQRRERTLLPPEGAS